MKARVWNTKQLQSVMALAVEGGYVSHAHGKTVKVYTPDEEIIVLQAMQHPSGKWIARYDDKVFKEKEAI